MSSLEELSSAGTIKLSDEELEALAALVLDRFRYFCQLFLSPEWFDKEFHGEVCDFIQYGGRDKLLILPRSHLKTTIAATLYPLWQATKDPNKRTLIVSNSQTNAKKTVRTIRGYVESNQWYQVLFPDRVPNFRKVRWSDQAAQLQRPESLPEATFEAAGVGSNIVRRHYDYIIEDDTVAPTKDEMSGEELMPSRAEIEKAVGFHKLTIPLLVDPRVGERIVILTRWASYDLANHILENEAIQEGEEADEGGRYFKTLDLPAVKEDGTPRFKRYDKGTLRSMKRSLGSYMYHMLYLNEPLQSEHMKFPPEWLVYYSDNELPPEDELTTRITIDPADPPTGNAGQDYTAVVVCSHHESGLYVREYQHGRYSDKQTISKAFDLAAKYDAHLIQIEEDRYAHLVAAFKRELVMRDFPCSVRGVKTRGRKKEARIMRLHPVMESRLFKLKRGMPELETELFQFPFGKHDDLIDALSWQVDKGFKVPYPTHQEHPTHTPPNTHTFEQIINSTAHREGKYIFGGGSLVGRWN